MTINEMDRVLERFHGALVAEISAQRPERLDEPFTVAEIYQTFVPYGTHRDRIGVEMNGDYEDALLRLLAGEGQYLLLDSEPALRRLKEEVSSPNPNTGLFREFAAVDVRLNPERVPSSSGAAATLRPAETAERDGGARAPASTGDRGPKGRRSSEGGAASETCTWCRAELPSRPNLTFCPFCGTNIHVVPCPECGEEVEPEWRFCIACGTEVHG